MLTIPLISRIRAANIVRFLFLFLFTDERIGNLVIVQKSAYTTAAVKTQLNSDVYYFYASPPAFGARIVDTVLNDAHLHAEWLENIQTMSSRIIKMRAALYDALTKLRTPGTWEHIIDQKGMFSCTGLSPAQVKFLIEDHHVYLRLTGRINISKLNELNIDYVAKAINQAVNSLHE